MKYSICSTIYNGASRLRKSLNSILNLMHDTEFEIVVVDSNSTDGTWQILEDYAKKYSNFKIIRKKCTRGKGRQIAFENSSGRYIIPVDLDTEYLPQWRELIDAYANWSGKDKYALQAVYSGIYPRSILNRAGGWRDLQYAEDLDLWWRLIDMNALKIYPLVTGKNWTVKDPEKRQTKNVLKILYRKYLNERSRFKVIPNYPISARLKEIRAWSSKSSYYAFWVPLIIISKLSVIHYKKRNIGAFMKKWFENMVDFGIAGEMRYDVINLPVSEKQGNYEPPAFLAASRSSNK